MKNGSTLFLRLALLGLGFIVLVLSVILLPSMFFGWAEEFPSLTWARYPAIFGLALTVCAFWAANYQLMNLLGLIEKNQAFSKPSVQAMKNVKRCGFFISAIYAAWMPLIFYIADRDDAPGLILIFGAVFVGIPFVVAIFAGVAQQLFQNAIDIKKENDLTV